MVLSLFDRVVIRDRAQARIVFLRMGKEINHALSM